MTEMSKNQVIETFNKHILEFIMDIERVFPNDTDITASRKSLSRTIIMIPKSVIRAFNEHFCMVYSNEIDSGNLDFFIDREKLSRFINLNTEYFSMLETTFGYTGVNVKIPIVKDISKMKIKKMVNFGDDKWVESEVMYEEYLNLLPVKEKEKKLSKSKYVTFLCFHSGKIIESGLCAEFMVEEYNIFLNIIRKSYEYIREALV